MQCSSKEQIIYSLGSNAILHTYRDTGNLQYSVVGGLEDIQVVLPGCAVTQIWEKFPSENVTGFNCPILHD